MDRNRVTLLTKAIQMVPEDSFSASGENTVM